MIRSKYLALVMMHEISAAEVLTVPTVTRDVGRGKRRHTHTPRSETKHLKNNECDMLVKISILSKTDRIKCANGGLHGATAITNTNVDSGTDTSSDTVTYVNAKTK